MKMAHLGHRVMSPAVRAEPVGAREEIRLEDRLQHQLQGCLDHPVARRWRSPGGAACRPPWGSSARAPAAGGSCGPSAATAARRGTPRRPARPRWSRRSAPSTPAVRAPLLPRTRSHATSRNAGIGDEVEQIIEPAMRIITGPTVQLGLDLQYPSLRPKQRELRVRRYSPATSWHSSILPADLLAPFAMCTPLACSDYYGASAPPTAISRQRTCPPPDRLPGGRATAGRFPRSPRNRSMREAPSLYPGSIATPTPQTFDRGLPTGPTSRLRSRPAPHERTGHALHTGPYPPGLSRHWTYGASDTGSSRTPSHLCLPDPGRLAVPTRPVRCQGCSHPRRAFPRSGCPQLHRPAATARRRSPFTSTRFPGASWRTVGFQKSAWACDQR